MRPFDPVAAETWPPVLDAAQVAAILGCGKRKVLQLARAGKIPGRLRLGRFIKFKTVAIRRWLEEAER